MKKENVVLVTHQKLQMAIGWIFKNQTVNLRALLACVYVLRLQVSLQTFSILCSIVMVKIITLTHITSVKWQYPDRIMSRWMIIHWKMYINILFLRPCKTFHSHILIMWWNARSVECRKVCTQWGKEWSLFLISASFFFLCNIYLQDDSVA